MSINNKTITPPLQNTISNLNTLVLQGSNIKEPSTPPQPSQMYKLDQLYILREDEPEPSLPSWPEFHTPYFLEPLEVPSLSFKKLKRAAIRHAKLPILPQEPPRFQDLEQEALLPPLIDEAQDNCSVRDAPFESFQEPVSPQVQIQLSEEDELLPPIERQLTPPQQAQVVLESVQRPAEEIKVQPAQEQRQPEKAAGVERSARRAEPVIKVTSVDNTKQMQVKKLSAKIVDKTFIEKKKDSTFKLNQPKRESLFKSTENNIVVSSTRGSDKKLAPLKIQSKIIYPQTQTQSPVSKVSPLKQEPKNSSLLSPSPPLQSKLSLKQSQVKPIKQLISVVSTTVQLRSRRRISDIINDSGSRQIPQNFELINQTEPTESKNYYQLSGGGVKAITNRSFKVKQQPSPNVEQPVSTMIQQVRRSLGGLPSINQQQNGVIPQSLVTTKALLKQYEAKVNKVATQGGSNDLRQRLSIQSPLMGLQGQGGGSQDSKLPSIKQKKKSHLRIIAEEQNLAGSDVFLPEQLRTKDPIMESARSKEHIDENQFNTTFNSSIFNSRITSEERNKINQKVIAQLANRDKQSRFSKFRADASPTPAESSMRHQKQFSFYQMGNTYLEISNDTKGISEQSALILLAPDKNPKPLRLKSRKSTKFLVKLQKKEQLDPESASHIANTSIYNSYNMPKNSIKTDNLRQTLTKIYFGSNPQTQERSSLPRKSSQSPSVLKQPRSINSRRNTKVAPNFQERLSDSPFATPLRSVKKITKKSLKQAMKQLYIGQNGHWLGDMAGIGRAKQRKGTSSMPRRASREQIREIVSALSIAIRNQQQAGNTAAGRSRRNHGVMGSFDGVSLGNGTSLCQDTISSFNRHNNSIQRENNQEDHTQRFKPKTYINPVTVTTSGDFGIDQILSDLKNSTKTIERILTNEKLHRVNRSVSRMSGGTLAGGGSTLMIPGQKPSQQHLQQQTKTFEVSDVEESILLPMTNQRGKQPPNPTISAESELEEDLDEEDEVNFN